MGSSWGSTRAAGRWCSHWCRAARGSGPGRSRWGRPVVLEGRDPGANSWPRSTVRGRRCGGPGPARLSSETSTARLEGALPPTGHHLVARPRRGDQYSAAHTARDGVVLPLAHPFAPVGDGGPLAQLVGDRSCPAPQDGPFLRRLLRPRAGAHLLVPAESVVQQAAVDRPVDGCVARPPGRGARVMMRPSICSGEPVPIPVSTGPPAPSAGDRPTRAGGGTAAPCAGSCRGRCSPCSTTSGPPPGCTTRSCGSRATPWTCPGRRAGRSRSPPHGSSSGP